MTDGPGPSSGPDSARMLEPGRVIARRYRVDGVLGRGGMGVVASGLQLDLERPVAIKFLRPNLAQNARPMQRFAREARAIAKMRSEHVVRVFDVGEEEGVPFIVMERLRGHDLAAELAQGPLSLAVTVEYLLQACEAIAEAHSLGIVHRDLKPSNLFLAEGFAGRRTLKVLDFGVSKWLGPAPDLTTPLSTSEGSFIGTPAYVSPEQLTQPDSVDRRADVWALGVVLYQCLSGRLPFQADSVPRLCAEILTAPPRPLDSGISLPSGFEMVILNCLRKELGERYPSILSLSQALTPFAPPTSLHLLDSIRALSQKIAADERPSAEPSEKPPAVEVPQTTLNFSHEADLAQKVYPSDTRARRRRTRWLALLAIAAAAALITRATWRTDTPASAPEDLTRAASVAPPSQPRRPEPTPNTSPSPPLTVAETAPPPPLRNAPAPSRSAANAGHARPSSSARLAAVAGASAETKAQPPSSASSAPAAPAQPARPVEQPSNPDAINPAELYRH